MIPTMIVFGLVFGRWWMSALIAAAIFWPVLLLWDGALQQSPTGQPLVMNILLAAGLAVANAAIGVAIHQLILFVVRKARATSGGLVSPGKH